MINSDWAQIHTLVLKLEQAGWVTRTFRRLDPERQQAVIAAILDEAGEYGPTSINIKRVAERAGVSIGSLYQYFGSREGLMTFTVELCVRLVTDTFNQYRSALAAMPLQEALAAYLAGGLEWGQTQAGLVQFFARAAYHGDPQLGEQVVRPIADVMREMVADILTQAAARGEIRTGVDLQATARVVNALMIAIGDAQLLPYLNIYLQVTDKKMPPKRVLEALLELVLRGIGVETP
jgi:AcrR family transcriptional regulator